MATKLWRGDAAAVAQVDYFSVSANHTVSTYSIVVGNKTVSAVGGTSSTVTCASLASAWEANESPEILEIGAAASGGIVILTASTAGMPFTASASVSGGTGAASLNSSVASSGPNHWDTAANWSPSGVPATNDSVYIRDSNVDILYGLSQTTSMALIDIDSSYTGRIGLPVVNDSGASSYYEYRTRDLTIGVATLVVGSGDGVGSGRININHGTVACTTTVNSTGTRAESGVGSLVLKGTSASNAVTILSGDVQLGGPTGSGYKAATVNVVDGTVKVGDLLSPSTVGTLIVSGGSVSIYSSDSAVPYVTIYAGSLLVNAPSNASFASVTINGGQVVWLTAAAVDGDVVVSNGGLIDYSQSPLARTVAGCEMYTGSSLYDPYSTVVFTTPIELKRCKLNEVALDLGPNRTITPG